MKALLSILGLIILSLSLVSCTGETASVAPLSSASDELQVKREVTQELWQELTNYKLELVAAEAIREESFSQIEKALKDEGFSMSSALQHRKRAYQIVLIEANTMKFIDSKPEYAMLHTLMWESGRAPTLAWATPELETDSDRREAEFEQYLQGYIDHHWYTVESFTEILRARAAELDIELHYTPPPYLKWLTLTAQPTKETTN